MTVVVVGVVVFIQEPNMFTINKQNKTKQNKTKNLTWCQTE